jgi:hypothetical protein
MRILITEKKLFSVVLKWLRREYPNLKKETIGPNIIFWDGKELAFLFHKKPMLLFISSDDNKLYNVLVDFFNLTEKQINKIIKLWIQKDYGLFVKNVTLKKSIN